MMKLFLLSFLLYGCAQVPSKAPEEENLVSVDAALNQARSSYLKGCVEAHKSLKKSPSFPQCRERARAHYLELQRYMDYNEEKPGGN